MVGRVWRRASGWVGLILVDSVGETLHEAVHFNIPEMRDSEIEKVDFVS